VDIVSSLHRYIGGLGAERIAVAYSGGYDSTFLLRSVSAVIPGGCTGVFVDSPLISERQRLAALNIAGHLGLSVIVAEIGWEDLPGVRENTPDRCYRCKTAIYRIVRETAEEIGADVCMDGENADDLADDRPGRRAALEHGILSPFAVLGIGRRDIVDAVGSMGIPEMIVKDTCMATRIRTGLPFSDRELRLAEDCESFIRNVTGVRQLRVRLDGRNATILTAPDETAGLMMSSDIIFRELRRKGLDPSVDPNGYKG
jgi:uncharacterized protein